MGKGESIPSILKSDRLLASDGETVADQGGRNCKKSEWPHRDGSTVTAESEEKRNDNPDISGVRSGAGDEAEGEAIALLLYRMDHRELDAQIIGSIARCVSTMHIQVMASLPPEAG
jgi:hypothetical protein